MRNYITFNGTDLRNYGMYISGAGRIQIPTRAYEFAQVPGKLGDVILGGRRIENEEIVYPAFIAPVSGACGNYATYEEAFFALRNYLLTVSGYQTLTDSYNGTYYRKACFVGGISADSMTDLKSGSFDLAFNCKPQRFFNVAAISVAAGVTKQALATFPAATANCEPIIEVTGTGDFYFYTGVSETQVAHITVSQNPDTVTIDCQRKECYYSGGSANQWVTFDNYQFPALGPFFGNAGAVKVTTNGVSLSIDPGAYLL